jgi:hypothetical protein
MLEAVFLVFQVVGLTGKEETVYSRSAAGILCCQVERFTIHVEHRSSAAVLLHTNEHALGSIAATQLEQKQVLGSRVHRGHRSVDVGTRLDGCIKVNLSGVAQGDRVEVLKALPLFAKRAAEVTATVVGGVWQAGVGRVAVGVVVFWTSGSAGAANGLVEAAKLGQGGQRGCSSASRPASGTKQQLRLSDDVDHSLVWNILTLERQKWLGPRSLKLLWLLVQL